MQEIKEVFWVKGKDSYAVAVCLGSEEVHCHRHTFVLFFNQTGFLPSYVLVMLCFHHLTFPFLSLFLLDHYRASYYGHQTYMYGLANKIRHSFLAEIKYIVLVLIQRVTVLNKKKKKNGD